MCGAGIVWPNVCHPQDRVSFSASRRGQSVPGYVTLARRNQNSISTGDCLLAQEWGLLWEGPCVCFPTARLVSLLFLQSFVQSSPQLQCHSGGEVPVGDERRAGSSPALFLPKGTGGHAALTLPVSASTALFLPAGLCLARAGQTAVEQLHERRGEYVEGTRPLRAPTEPRSC